VWGKFGPDKNKKSGCALITRNPGRQRGVGSDFRKGKRAHAKATDGEEQNGRACQEKLPSRGVSSSLKTPTKKEGGVGKRYEED